jgi:hypothetical protein
MWDFHVQSRRIGDSLLGHFHLEKEIPISRDMPDDLTIALREVQNAQQRKPTLELEDQEISRVKFLKHGSRLA